jgi:hypothetical protein
LAIAFLGAGSIKVIGTKTSIEMRDHVAVGAPPWRVIGALELAAAAGLVPGLFIPAFGGRGCHRSEPAASAGAVVAHLRVDDAGGAPPALVLLVLAIVYIVLRIMAW